MGYAPQNLAVDSPACWPSALGNSDEALGFPESLQATVSGFSDCSDQTRNVVFLYALALFLNQ